MAATERNAGKGNAKGTMMVGKRIGPSPTGYMHIGNLRTALCACLLAKHSGDKFVLRTEGTDQNRNVPSLEGG